MSLVNVQLLKTQCEAFAKLGLTQDQVITTILGNEAYKHLPPADRDSLAMQIQSYLAGPALTRAATSVQATLVPVFPISTIRYTSTGEQKQILDKTHPENLKYLITSIMQIHPAFNELKNRTYVNGIQIKDKLIGSIRNRCREYGLSDSKDFVIEVFEELADENKYHPFLKALEGVTWDGHDHITDLFNTLTLSEHAKANRDFVFQYMRRWLIAVCKKVVTPGSQNLTLTFKSKQGDGKSRWLEKLASIAPEIYGEGSVDVSNKDHDLRHLNYLIWHIPEIDGSMRKSDAGLLKDYLTKAKVNVREAYGRNERTGDSVLSFFASVNAEEFLVDDTGARRFLVIELDDLNPDHDVNITQVWAQAMHLCLAGEKYYFDKEEIKTINEMNGSYQTKNHVDEIVRRIEAGPDWMSGVEIFAAFLGKPSPNNAELSKLGLLLKRANIERDVRKINGIKTTVYKIKKPDNPIF